MRRMGQSILRREGILVLVKETSVMTAPKFAERSLSSHHSLQAETGQRIVDEMIVGKRESFQVRLAMIQETAGSRGRPRCLMSQS
jgi:hypothetical protein